MTGQNLKSNFEIFINKYKEKFKGENIALAVSGGSDSLALAYLANNFKIMVQLSQSADKYVLNLKCQNTVVIQFGELY